MNRIAKYAFQRFKKYLLFFAVILFLFTSCRSDDYEFADGEDPLPEKIDFNLHVRTILSENCFACHGPDAMAREADLRLDTEEGAFTALTEDENKFAIVKGEPEKSDLYKRIISDDPDYMMPAPNSNLSLSDREIAILKKWIEQNAEYKPHWSLIPPEKLDLPQVKKAEWPENPIDYFILKKIEEKGIEPSREAGREMLLRRVSFDLTGLPPTIEELKAFLSDHSPDAYEKAVDHLMDSEAYGERMAMEWLDVARYADSHGYQDDGPNEMWPWREWVINAFNRNMPFDEFATWQLAGDLLPGASRDQKLATGFSRIHPQNQEDGIVGEEYRVEYVANRVQTTATAFLGITMQCARCHDHKFDPISEKEYYEFAAFFDNINDPGQVPNAGNQGGRLVLPGPTIQLPSPEAEKQIRYLEDAIASQEQQMNTLKSDPKDAFLSWRKQPGTKNTLHPEVNGLYASLDLDDIQEDKIIVHHADSVYNATISGTLQEVDGINGGALEFEKGNFIDLGDIGRFERSDPFSFSFWIDPSDTVSEMPVLAKTGSIHIGYRGYDISLFENRVSMRLIHGWPFNSIQVITQESLLTDEWNHIAVTYDGSSKALGINIHINGREVKTRVEQNKLFKNIRIEKDEPRYSKQNLLVGERVSNDRLNYTGLKLDEIKIFNRELSAAEILALAGHDAYQDLLETPPENYSDHQKQVLLDYYLLTFDEDYKKQRKKLHALRAEKNAIRDTLREVMVMEERLNPRKSYVRKRGLYDQLGEEVEPNVPKSILNYPDNLPKNRLGLAQWLMDPDNPLTSRVIVNRYWQMFFGQGLVDTPDNFGNQGSLPTHPELLDWLAVNFRENDWDLKALLKQIVMSATYRQSSKTTPQLRENDPQNRWLARGPRYRLTAEMIRDNALVASGLLVRKIGGPSVFPYQPKGLWKETTSNRHLTEYIQDEGESLYRRSLYTFWKRTSPPPGMTTFDAAMRTHPTVKRQETSTPLQALNVMNDPIYIEASRLLAERMMKESGNDIREQIMYAFIAATSRVPDDSEIDMLQDLYLEVLAGYQEEPKRAGELLQTGEYSVDKNLDTSELAARTVIASTILNLDETITKK